MAKVTIDLETARFLLEDLGETIDGLDPDMQRDVIAQYRYVEAELLAAIESAHVGCEVGAALASTISQP